MMNDDDWELGFMGLRWDVLDAWVWRFPEGLPSPMAQPPSHEQLAAMAQRSPYPVDGARALLRDHAVQDWRDVVRRLACPLVAIAGRESAFWPWQHATWMADAAPDGRAVIVDGAGHAVNLDRPEAVIECLRGALGAARPRVLRALCLSALLEAPGP